MFTARRTLAGIAILGLVIALVVIQQTRGDGSAVDLADSALPPADDAGTTRRAASAATPAIEPAPASASTTGADDESIGMCTQILDDAAAFAEMERIAADPPLAEPSQDRPTNAELARNLAGSPDPESFLTAYFLGRTEARVSDDSSAQAKLLELGLRAANSGSPLLAWHALRVCVAAEEYCPFPHLEQSLLESDQDNAEAWALVATLRYRRGDVSGALTAMRDAARASTSTWYLTETSAMIERSLAEQTSRPNFDRQVVAITFAQSALADDSISPMCRVESASSDAWGEACLAFGSLREEHNETDLGRLLAYKIREQTLTALGDLDGAAKVADEFALYVAGRGKLFESIDLIGELVATKPERWPAYLNAVREFGEIEGSRIFLRQELPLLLERAGLLDRDGARECGAQALEAPAAVGTFSATYQGYPVAEYPLRVGDQLQIFVRGQNRPSALLQVGPDGAITLPRAPSSRMSDVPAIAAAGKTTAQIEREIATILSERDPSSASLNVFVSLVAPRSPEEFQLEFDTALREATESREEPR